MASHSQKVAISFRGHDKPIHWSCAIYFSRWYKPLVELCGETCPFTMSVSKNRGTPKWMVHNGKPYSSWCFGGKTHYFSETHHILVVAHYLQHITSQHWDSPITSRSYPEEFLRELRIAPGFFESHGRATDQRWERSSKNPSPYGLGYVFFFWDQPVLKMPPFWYWLGYSKFSWVCDKGQIRRVCSFLDGCFSRAIFKFEGVFIWPNVVFWSAKHISEIFTPGPLRRYV